MAKIGGIFEDRRKGRRVGWRVVWYDFTGQRRERRCPGLSKDEARELWRQLSAQGQLEAAGARVPASRITLAEYVEKQFLPGRPAEVDAETLRGELATWENHIKPALGTRTLTELTPDVVRAAMGALRHREHTGRPGRPAERKASPQLQRKFKVTLTRFVRRAASSGLYGSRAMFDGDAWRTPFASVKPPRAPKKTRVRLEPHEAAAVLRASYVVAGPRGLMTVSLAALAGFRRGEVPALEWSDVRWALNGQRLAVGAELVGERDPNELLVNLRAEVTKDNEDRTLSLKQPEVVSVFLAERRRRPAARFVFEHERAMRRRGKVLKAAGEALVRPLQDDQWRLIKQVADVPDALRFHDLRGSFAVILLQSGQVSESAVQELLGHGSIATTRQHYTEVRARRRVHDAASVFEGMQLGLSLPTDGADEGPVREVAGATSDVAAPKGPAKAWGDKTGRTSPAGLPRDAKGRSLAERPTGDPYGDTLRAARVAARVSQQTLAERCEAAFGGTWRTWQQRLSQLERGKWRPDPATRTKLGALLAELLHEPALRFAPVRAAGGAA